MLYLINTFYSFTPYYISAQMNFAVGFPILWFFGTGNQSSMQYKGPKDIDSLMFFINELTGNGARSRKVSETYSIFKVRLKNFFLTNIFIFTQN